jgi:hypothetical protein
MKEMMIMVMEMMMELMMMMIDNNDDDGDDDEPIMIMAASMVEYRSICRQRAPCTRTRRAHTSSPQRSPGQRESAQTVRRPPSGATMVLLLGTAVGVKPTTTTITVCTTD